MRTPAPALLALFLFFQKRPAAQTLEPFIENARSLSLATATVSLPGQPGMAGNPASLAFFEKKSAVEASAATPYFIKNWKKLALSGTVPLGATGHIFSSIARAGIPEFQWTRFRVGYARQLSPKIGVGATADFSQIRAGEYGGTSAVSVGIGLLWHPRKDFWYAASIQNPTSTGWKTGEARSPVIRWGGMYQLNPLVGMVLELEKALGTPPVLKGGLEYSMLKKLVLRSGIRSGPFRWAFGAGLPLRDGLAVDFAVDWHPTLGLTPGATVAWSGERKKKAHPN